MNQASGRSLPISRRRFLRDCTISASALASLSVLGCRSLISPKTAQTTGPASFRFSLDQDWLFGGKFTADTMKPQFDDKAFSKVTLPHCVAKLSWQGWHPAKWEDVWIYRRHFSLPKEFKHRRVFLDFDGVMNGATPAINGHGLSEHAGGYLPFHYEITDWVKHGNNVLAVAIDSRWNAVPPDGNPKGPTSVDYLEAGGIVRPVALRAVPQIFISDVFAKPVNVLDNRRRVEVTCTIDAAVIPPKPLQLKVEMLDGDLRVATVSKTLILEQARRNRSAAGFVEFGQRQIVGRGLAAALRLVTTLMLGNEPLHDCHTRIGLREARFEVDGFFLNGRRFRFMGLDRHEIYPYVGFAMPARVMRRDAEILRREFNCNAVRCSHYPQTEAFLDACDELGLMVWEETPGWRLPRRRCLEGTRRPRGKSHGPSGPKPSRHHHLGCSRQ